MSKHYDLLICLRCHAYRDLILDTIDAVKCYTDSDVTKIVCAVDKNNRSLAKHIERVLPQAVHCSGHSWGWGAGLYGLLAESIIWADERWNFSHFVSIDYDTLFIKKGADQIILNHITDPEIGLLGHYGARSTHWEEIFNKDKLKIRKYLGEIPKTYHPGEGTQGGCMILTRTFIDALKRKGMLISPFAIAKNITQIEDDHLVTLFCRMCGLEIVQVSEQLHIRWQLDCDPLGLEKKDIYIFHPTKVVPSKSGQSIEKTVRNYYRTLRGRGPLA